MNMVCLIQRCNMGDLDGHNKAFSLYFSYIEVVTDIHNSPLEEDVFSIIDDRFQVIDSSICSFDGVNNAYV